MGGKKIPSSQCLVNQGGSASEGEACEDSCIAPAKGHYGADNTCYWCGATGHTQRDCYMNRCWFCKSEEHAARSCPELFSHEQQKRNLSSNLKKDDSSSTLQDLLMSGSCQSASAL